MPRTTSIVKYVIKTFLLHASIVKPLGESGKLQLTSDMTEVEFALNTFMVDSPQSKSTGGLESIGSEYKALRAMRYIPYCGKCHSDLTRDCLQAIIIP